MFTLPVFLGSVSERYDAGDGSNKVIHIQDAHCNYACQIRISEIIDHLNRKYSLDVLNLEGGKGEYDLSVFELIEDDGVRKKVADYFVREGMLNGAEYFAVNNPERAFLWGIEDKDLYIENLNAYRDSLKNKQVASEHIAVLRHILENLKRNMYSKDMLEVETRYKDHAAGETELKDHLSWLVQRARELDLDEGYFPNVLLVYESLAREQEIDFRRANIERDELTKELENVLSRRELSTLALKVIEFGEEIISRQDFYRFLVNKGVSIGLDLDNYPELIKYTEYAAAYESIDGFKLMAEIDELADSIRQILCVRPEEYELSVLSKHLGLIEKLFDIKLTKHEYRYYTENEASFKVRNFTDFICKYAGIHGITARPGKDIGDLDIYRKDITRFYEHSFRRDVAFLENISSGQGGGGGNVPVIVVTGGFHTENLSGLFRERGISFVSIMPRFKNCENSENPYFDILSGNHNGVVASLDAALSAMQVPSLWNALGISASAPGSSELSRIAVTAVAHAEASGKGVAVKISENDYLVLEDHEGSYVFSRQESVSENIEVVNEGLGDVDITDVRQVRWALSNMGQDMHIRGEFRAGNVISINEQENAEMIARIRHFLQGLENPLPLETFECLLNEEKIYSVPGLLNAHAGGMGLYVSAEAEAGDKAADIVHEIIAGLYSGTSDGLNAHELAQAFENAFWRSDPSPAGQLLSRAERLQGQGGIDKSVWEMTPEERMRAERDYAADVVDIGRILARHLRELLDRDMELYRRTLLLIAATINDSPGVLWQWEEDSTAAERKYPSTELINDVFKRLGEFDLSEARSVIERSRIGHDYDDIMETLGQQFPRRDRRSGGMDQIRDQVLRDIGRPEDPDPMPFESSRRESLERWKQNVLQGVFEDYAVIGDVHGDLERLKEMIKDLEEEQGIKKYVFVGDYLDRGEQNLEVLDFIRGLKDQNRAELLLGNHDLYFIQSVLFGDQKAFGIWIMNGGYRVLEESKIDTYEMRHFMADLKNKKEEGWHPTRAIMLYNYMNPDLVEELLSQVRAHQGLMDWAIWARNNMKLFHFNEQGMLFLHAGLPLDHEGNVALSYKGKTRMDALRQMQEDLEECSSKDDGVLNALVSESSPLLVRDGWIGMINRPGVAEKILDQMGVNGIVFGHTPQNELLNIDNKIFGIDLKLSRGMTSEGKGHGGNLVFSNRGIIFNDHLEQGIEREEILSRNALIKELEERIARLSGEEEAGLARRFRPPDERLDAALYAEEQVYLEFAEELNEQERRLIAAVVVGHQTKDLRLAGNIISQPSDREIGSLPPRSIRLYMELGMRDMNALVLLSRIVSEGEPVYINAQRTLSQKAQRFAERVSPAIPVPAERELTDDERGAIRVFTGYLSPEEKKLILGIHMASENPGLGVFVVNSPLSIEELGLEFTPETVESYLKMRLENINQFRMLRQLIIPADRVSEYSGVVQNLRARTEVLLSELSHVREQRQDVNWGEQLILKDFLIGLSLAEKKLISAVLLFRRNPASALEIMNMPDILAQNIEMSPGILRTFIGGEYGESFLRYMRIGVFDPLNTEYREVETTLREKTEQIKRRIDRAVQRSDSEGLDDEESRLVTAMVLGMSGEFDAAVDVLLNEQVPVEVSPEIAGRYKDLRERDLVRLRALRMQFKTVIERQNRTLSEIYFGRDRGSVMKRLLSPRKSDVLSRLAAERSAPAQRPMDFHQIVVDNVNTLASRETLQIIMEESVGRIPGRCGLNVVVDNIGNIIYVGNEAHLYRELTDKLENREAYELTFMVFVEGTPHYGVIDLFHSAGVSSLQMPAFSAILASVIRYNSAIVQRKGFFPLDAGCRVTNTASGTVREIIRRVPGGLLEVLRTDRRGRVNVERIPANTIYESIRRGEYLLEVPASPDREDQFSVFGAAPQHEDKVYTDTEPLYADIEALKTRLGAIGIGNLPRVGFHGELAGHTPVGEFHYFVFDPSLQDYWQERFRGDLDTLSELHRGNLSFSDMQMGNAEFFDRLLGTVIFVNDYGATRGPEGSFSEIYLLVNREDLGFSLRDGRRGKEKAVADLRHPVTGELIEYGILHVEGMHKTESIPGEAIFAKIGLTAEEIKATMEWAQTNGKNAQEVEGFVCMLLYKKVLENMLELVEPQGSLAVLTERGIVLRQDIPMSEELRTWNIAHEMWHEAINNEDEFKDLDPAEKEVLAVALAFHNFGEISDPHLRALLFSFGLEDNASPDPLDPDLIAGIIGFLSETRPGYSEALAGKAGNLFSKVRQILMVTGVARTEQNKKAKSLRDDLWSGSTDIITMPGSNLIQHQRSHFAVARNINRESPDRFRSDTVVNHYEYHADLDAKRREELLKTLEKNIRELETRVAAETREGLSPRARHLAYIDARDMEYAQEFVNNFRPEIKDRTLLLPLENIPVHGVLDDVYLVTGAKGLLDAKRTTEGDYDGVKRELDLDRARRLTVFLDTFLDLSGLPDGIDINDPQAVIGAILRGALLRIRPIDFRTIQEYHDRQLEVMRSL